MNPSAQRSRNLKISWLQQQNVAASAFAEIPEAKIRQFAAEARSLDLTSLNDMPERKRLTLAGALILRQVARALDDVADMFIRQVKKIFGRHSLKRRLVKYIFQTRRCWKCRIVFGVDERFTLFRKYGWNLAAYFFYQVIELCIPQLTVVRSFNRLFGFDLNGSTLYNLKVRIGGYYAETKQKILENIIQGCLVHADETRANIKGKAGFVWVLTNMQEVIYVLADSREGEVVQKLLGGFQGVVVSDFYPAYDSLGCPQQRCLIHLMRDLNDEVLTNPFDDPLKEIVTAFAKLLKPMVETVERHGLKKYFLRMCRFTKIFCALWCCRPAVFRRVPIEIRDYLKTFPFCRHSTCSRTQIYRQRCFRLVEVDGVSGQNRRCAPFRNGIKFTNIMGDYKGRVQLRQRKRRFAKN